MTSPDAVVAEWSTDDGRSWAACMVYPGSVIWSALIDNKQKECADEMQGARYRLRRT